jgi:hypothetical protein
MFMSAATTVTYDLRKGLGGRKHKLTFAVDFLQYDDTRIAAADIIDIKHRMRWIVWYKFYVGRVYEMVIRHADQSELRITFNSHFGLRKQYMDVYANIIETFWAMYFQKVVDRQQAVFKERGELTISGVQLLKEGVRFSVQGELVPWEKVGYAEYYSYFALYHADRAKLNVRRDFYAWESEILLSLIRTIKAERATDI